MRRVAPHPHPGAVPVARLPDLPRIPLIRRPTPLAAADRLAGALGLASLAVKREDLAGFSLGGNKPRQLEAILARARAEGADTLITSASAQSNFCQCTAAAAAHLGWRCILLLRRGERPVVQGNLLLDRLYGAEIGFLDSDDPYDPDTTDRLAETALSVRAEGGRPFVIHLTGQTGALAAAAATDLAVELAAQFPRPAPGILCLAVGSGLTAAGLTLGFRHLGLATRVVGISVQQPAEFLRPLMVARANAAAALLGLDTRLAAADVELDDRFIAPGYGRPSRASIDAVLLAGRHGALLLDPAYSGKALAGLGRLRAEGRLDADGGVVFLHTGGAASLFLHAARLDRAAPPAAAP